MLIARNIVEFLLLFLFWAGTRYLITHSLLTSFWLLAPILIGAWAKSAFFGGENLQQLWKASTENMPYHHFMLLMLVNMSQIMLSFGLDYHSLHCLNPRGFSSILPELNRAELVFEFFYFSVLNFTFFG